jgi:hypothetical protein
MPGTIDVSPNPVPEGCPVKITATGGEPGGQVTVTIQNGEGGPTATVTIPLDGQGNGSTTWPVPNGWAGNGTASFDSPGYEGDTILVDQNNGQECPDL